MPRLLPETKKALDSFRLGELRKSKSMQDFGYRVSKIGLKGGKHHNQCAANAGRQMLQRMSVNILEKLDEGQIIFSEEMVSVLKGAVTGQHEVKQFDQMKWAVEQGLKVGMLGGYAPEKTQSLNMNIGVTTDPAIDALRAEFESKLLEKMGDES